MEGKRENYQVCSVQYCVQQLYTVHTQNRSNSCLLVRFRFSVLILRAQFICDRFSFLGLFCVIPVVYLCMCTFVVLDLVSLAYP